MVEDVFEILSVYSGCAGAYKARGNGDDGPGRSPPIGGWSVQTRHKSGVSDKPGGKLRILPATLRRAAKRADHLTYRQQQPRRRFHLNPNIRAPALRSDGILQMNQTIGSIQALNKVPQNLMEVADIEFFAQVPP